MEKVKDKEKRKDKKEHKEKKSKQKSKKDELSPEKQEKIVTSIPPPVALNLPTAVIICESCGTSVNTILYCIECDRLLCQSCDIKGHTLPIDSKHYRIPISEEITFKNVRQFCSFHPNKFLKYFCRTCSVPLCEECRVTGHHNSQPHESIPIFDA